MAGGQLGDNIDYCSQGYGKGVFLTWLKTLYLP